MLFYSFQILYFKRKQLEGVLEISKSDQWQIWKSPIILFIALQKQNLFLFIFGALNQPKCDNMYPSHGKPVLYNTCRFWWTLKRNNGNNKWAINTILIYFKPLICGLTSMVGDCVLTSPMVGDMILTCFLTLRLPALRLSVFACIKQELCVQRTRSVCSVASRFSERRIGGLSSADLSREVRPDALSSSLQSPPPGSSLRGAASIRMRPG